MNRFRFRTINMLPHSDHSHAETCSVPGDVAADAAEPNQPHCRSGNLARTAVQLPDVFLCPYPLLLKTRRLRNSLRHCEDHGYDLLGNNRAVDLARIGQDHITVHKFREQKLMNGSGRRVDPSELARDAKLFWVQ